MECGWIREFGWKDKELDLGHVEFQAAMGHQNRNVRYVLCNMGLYGSGKF